MTTKISQCFGCKSFIEDKRFTCKVYPNGIPDSLLFNKRKCSKIKEQGYGKIKKKMESRRPCKGKTRR